MKIILKKDVYGLGYKDEVLVVKDGYGRNYLLPQKLAVLATDKAVKQLEEELKQRAHKIAKQKADAQAEADKFQGVSLTITVRTSVEGTIYGSVGPAQIAEELNKQGLTINPKQIVAKGVKTVGDHTAILKFHKDVEVELPFTVVSDQPLPAKAKVEEKPAEVEAAAQEEAEIEEANEATAE